MNEAGKLLVVAGLILAGIGVVLWSGIGKNWLGKLPGDIHYSKGNMRVYFPVVTCLILSLVVSLILRFFRK
jgi:hypothetical protein